MKRIFALGISILFSGAALAQTDGNELPQRANDFIDEHFAAENITEIDIDDSWYNMSDSETYEVEFESGIELDFNKKGEITEIETEDAATIPMSVFPESIRTTMERGYSGAEIVAWEKDKQGHEVELRDGTQLSFDSNGKMKKDHKKRK